MKTFRDLFMESNDNIINESRNKEMEKELIDSGYKSYEDEFKGTHYTDGNLIISIASRTTPDYTFYIMDYGKRNGTRKSVKTLQDFIDVILSNNQKEALQLIKRLKI